MRKPEGIAYGVDDRPPRTVVIVGSLQHVVLIAIRLVFPLIVAREAGVPEAMLLDVLALSMIAIGLAAILQALPRGPVGSGFLVPASFTSPYIAPALVAAKSGGLGLVAGMTIFGGLIECLMSRLLRPLRPYFPSEIAGLVVVVIGVMLGSLGTRYVLGVGTPGGASVASVAVVVITLAAIIALNVYGKGNWKVFSPLTGAAIGYLVAWLLGIFDATSYARVADAPFVHVPGLVVHDLAFDVSLAVPFIIAALASALRTMGDVTTAQKINDADWSRPDMRSIERGVLANGIATTFGGLVGSLGMNTLTSSIGLSGATGLTSRVIAYWIGGMLVVLAFFPKFAAMVVVMPAPVLGAVLWFSAAFVLVNGLQIVTSRMFDTRRTLVFGLAFTIALGVDLYPSVFAHAPASVQPFTGSSLVAGTIVALVLNAILRIGVRRVKTLRVDPRTADPHGVHQFMVKQGAAWGARRDVIERASFNIVQSLETIANVAKRNTPIDIEAAFDEYRLDLRVIYDGPPLELPTERPSPEEIIGSLVGEQRLAGFMLRSLADKVAVGTRGGSTVVTFGFDH